MIEEMSTDINPEMTRGYMDMPVHLKVQGLVVCSRTSKCLLGNQQESFYLALASHESLLLFPFFHFEVYMTENKCPEKKETCLFSHQQSKIFFC